MASNVKTSTTNTQANRVQQYLDGQLEKTRGQVKWNDLIVACLTWAAAVAAFLLVLALIDAWVVSFSTAGRWIAWATLMLSSLAWLGLAIVPLFLRKINLNYAAQMIEQATPDVKNSILNYSLLRKQDQSINVAVMDAVSRQAAHKLKSIPSDNTIDRSQLIRVGFILVGLMVFAVTYKLISPRDPLQTVQRILFPGQSLAKPASVQISQVTPGNARVFFGDSLQVTAQVKGPHRPEDVRLVISSDDGQIADLPIPMEIDETGRSYQGLISPGAGGIQQALRYRVEARDGVSPEFKIVVKANPSIAIETIELTPPTYTRLPKRTLKGRGDLEAIEGTEAMIFAAANLPIQVAYIELLNAVPGDDPQNPNATVMKPAAPPIEMRLLPDNRASGRFNVTLNSTRTRPRATHYQIRFVSTNDERNETPNVYPIRVTPDLAPEIRIVEPRSTQTEVASNGRLPILIEANDLDFAIGSVVLNMDYQGRQLIRQSLKLKSNNGNQRVNCRFLFEPSRYQLQPGDQVVFQAVAADNRISIKSLAPDPNVSQTENYTVSITEPESEPDRQPADDGNRETDPDKNSADDATDNSDEGSGRDSDQTNNDPPNDGTQDRDPESESGNQSDPSSESETDSGSEPSDEGSNPEDGGGGQPEDGGGTQGSQSNDQPPEDGNQGSGAEQNGGSTEQSQSGDQQNSGATGRNERRNDGVSNQGNSNGSSKGGGNEGGAEGSQGGGSNDPSETGSGGTPDGSEAQGPAGTNQDDPNAQAADQPNQGGAKGSDTNGGAHSDPGDTGSGEEGTRDGSLKNGRRERLPEDVHDGEKFEKLDELLKDQPPSERNGDQQTGDQQGSNQQGGDQQGGNQQGADQQSGDQQGGNQQGGNQQGDDQQGGDQQSGNQQGGNQQGGDQQGGDQQSGNQQGDDQQGGNQQGGDQQGGDQQGGDQQGGDQQGGDQQGGDQQGGDQQSGNQQGGDQQSGEPAGNSPSQPGTGQAGQPGQSPSQSSGASGQGGQPGGGAATSGQQSSGAGTNQATNEELEKEQADLDHAKKATDLVLNKLEDQLQNPDPDLLDKMNWTEQDLREFLNRWKRMKQSAQAGEPNAKREYEEAIKSLGLRPDDRSRTAKNRDANASGLNQDTTVIEPPADLAPDFNEFLRDRNRVR